MTDREALAHKVLTTLEDSANQLGWGRAPAELLLIQLPPDLPPEMGDAWLVRRVNLFAEFAPQLGLQATLDNIIVGIRDEGGTLPCLWAWVLLAEGSELDWEAALMGVAKPTGNQCRLAVLSAHDQTWFMVRDRQTDRVEGPYPSGQAAQVWGKLLRTLQGLARDTCGPFSAPIVNPN